MIIYLKIIFTVFNYTFVNVSVYEHMSTAAQEGQRHWIFLELESQKIVIHFILFLIIKLRSLASEVPTCKRYFPNPQISSLCIEKPPMNLKYSIIYYCNW